jgi:hypothetical protein
MVGARHLDRPDHALEAELLDALGGEIEMLDAPAHLLAGHRLVAELGHGGADRFGAQHRVDQAAVVEHRADLVGLGERLARGDDELLEVGIDRRLAGRMLQHQRLVARTLFAGRNDVGLGARPPHAQHLVAREVDVAGLGDGGRVHDAPAPQQDVVGLLLADLQPLRFLLGARRRHRNRQELEAVLLGHDVERRDRLLAVGRIVIEQRDLLALELVEAAHLLGDVLDGDVGCRPVGAEQREVPFEHRAVAAVGAAVAHGDQRDLVARRLLGQREGDTGAERAEIGRPGRTLALEALVALHAAVGGVAGLALLEEDFYAVDAAVARVQQGDVVGGAVGERHAVGGIGAGAIDEARDELLVLRHGGRRGDDAGRHDRRAEQRCLTKSHRFLLN